MSDFTDGLGRLGRGLPVVGGLIDMFGGSPANDARQAQIDAYQKFLDSLPGGPNADPSRVSALARLEGLSKNGITPDILNELLHQRMGADQMAQGREGALAQREAMMGRGVSNSGSSMVAQQQASQDAATRQMLGGMQTVGTAATNQRNALSDYLSQLGRIDQMRAWATGGLAGAQGNSQNFYGAQEAGDRKNLSDLASKIGGSNLFGGGGGAPGGGFNAGPASGSGGSDPFGVMGGGFSAGPSPFSQPITPPDALGGRGAPPPQRTFTTDDYSSPENRNVQYPNLGG